MDSDAAANTVIDPDNLEDPEADVGDEGDMEADVDALGTEDDPQPADSAARAVRPSAARAGRWRDMATPRREANDSALAGNLDDHVGRLDAGDRQHPGFKTQFGSSFGTHQRNDPKRAGL